MIVVKNAAYTIEGGTAALKYFPFLQKERQQARLCSRRRRGKKKKYIKKWVLLSVHKGQHGKKEEEKWNIYLNCFSAGRPCCLLSGSG